MRKLLIIAVLAFFATTAHAQANLFSAGLCHTAAAPAFNPGAKGCRLALDTTTQIFYVWKIGTTWVALGQTVDEIVGCSAPLYTPTKWQSEVVINHCTPNPELYYYFSGSWHLAGGVSTTYTAGTGIDITGTVISNTGDLSNTNELQNLSLAGQALSISGGTGVTLPIVGATASDFDLASGVLSLDYTNAQKATALVPGFLTAADWATFNSKGVGSVTSVGLSLPSIFSVSGSPVTGSGTLTGTLATQTANTVFAGPTTGVAATPTFRALVAADIPAASASKWTDGGATTYLTATGDNVAIGTTSSSSKLLVVSPSTSTVFSEFRNSIGASLLSIRENSNSSLNMTLGDPGGAGVILFSSSSGANSYVASGGNFGVNTLSPDRLLHAESTGALTNTVAYPQRLTHITSGTATTGFGAGQEIELENGSGTNRVAMAEETTYTDAVNATEDATYKLRLIKAGTLTDALTVTSTGDVTVAASITGTNLISTATVRLKGYTVATLPAGVVGDMAYVTDATAPTYGAVAVGGGAVVTPVFYNGTNWTTR